MQDNSGDSESHKLIKACNPTRKRRFGCEGNKAYWAWINAMSKYKALIKLKPSYNKKWDSNCRNVSVINDGAADVVVMSEPI
ncbi:MAG: hypothetical protein P4L49_15900 [Desulfosporosinus sp.]|nr:hypothetical protein [Desulfosporosinus sp.]